MHRSRFVRTRILFWITIFAGLLLNIPQAISESVSQDSAELIISEFMAANRTTLADEDGDYSDWIEIYNRAPRPVNLSDWSLTDDPKRPHKWTFPDITLESEGHLLVFASGKDRKSTHLETQLHTNFKLNRQREFLGLYHIGQDQYVDVALPAGLTQAEAEPTDGFPEQVDDVSYGRHSPVLAGPVAELAYGYLATATPGQPNAESLRWIGLVAPVKFSRERGFYKAPITVELSTPTPQATIRYTTDGSPPAETYGTIYTAPITINSTTLLRAAAFKPDFRPSPVATHTYIFLEDVLTQPANPAGFPQTWGGYQGAPVPADYEMDPEVVNDPRYGEVMAEALTALPTLSLVTDLHSFHDLYANPRRKGRAWERPVSVELIDALNGQQDFQVNAGLRIHGELGRSESIPKHGFRLFFRREYGPGKLHYPLFPDSPVEEFDTLVLRSGVNRSYAGYPNRESDIKLTTYARDEWLRRSQLAMSGAGARGIFVHLYLNGLYWGLYNVVERPDADFMAAYFGGAEKEWQTITHEESLTTSSERFKTLYRLARDGQLQKPETYAAIQSYLDVPQFIDYLILNWYVGNLDWGFNNWYAGVRSNSGPVRYFAWDGERIWYEGAEIFMDREEYLDRPNLITPLFEALLANPDFRLELADRMYRHLFNGGALSEANSQARWLNLTNRLEPTIVAESARWGDTRFERPLTQEDWLAALDDVLAQMEDNSARLIALAREAGYYPEIDPPGFHQPGGLNSAGFSLTLTQPASQAGAIYYTTDGSDPRLPGTGGIAAQAKPYTGRITLTSPTRIKARVLQGQTWSALNEATFEIED